MSNVELGIFGPGSKSLRLFVLLGAGADLVAVVALRALDVLVPTAQRRSHRSGGDDEGFGFEGAK